MSHCHTNRCSPCSPHFALRIKSLAGNSSHLPFDKNCMGVLCYVCVWTEKGERTELTWKILICKGNNLVVKAMCISLRDFFSLKKTIVEFSLHVGCHYLICVSGLCWQSVHLTQALFTTKCLMTLSNQNHLKSVKHENKSGSSVQQSGNNALLSALKVSVDGKITMPVLCNFS